MDNEIDAKVTPITAEQPEVKPVENAVPVPVEIVDFKVHTLAVGTVKVKADNISIEGDKILVFVLGKKPVAIFKDWTHFERIATL